MDKNGRALCGPHCAGRGLWQLRGVSCGQVWKQRRPLPGGGWPFLTLWAWASQEGSGCPWVPGALHTQLTEPLHRQRPRGSEGADNSDSAFLGVPSCRSPRAGAQEADWGKERSWRSREGAAGQRGEGDLPGKPLLPAEVPGAQVKVAGEQGWSPAAWAIRKQALGRIARGGRGTGPGGAVEKPGSCPLDPARSGTRPDPRPPPRHPEEQPRGLPGGGLEPAGGERSAAAAGGPGRRDSRSRGACASAGAARDRRAWRTARTERAGTAS